MKTKTFMTEQPLLGAEEFAGVAALPELTGMGHPPGAAVRHILLGSPASVRQTIHLLHTLRYAETVLWSPMMTVAEPLVITPAQGEAMSLLRRIV